MQILQLSDIHGADFLLEEIIPELEKADLVTLVGDITHFGHREAAASIVEKIFCYNDNILAVAGNCDHTDVDEYLDELGIGIHRKIIEKQGIQWAGISGSLPCPGVTPYEFSDEELAAWLIEMGGQLRSAPSILVAHQPPYNTINDALPDGQHVGSLALRSFLEKQTPLICLTAHIHEGIGIDHIKGCGIVNPGPFRTGKYALIDISGENSVNIRLKQITV